MGRRDAHVSASAWARRSFLFACRVPPDFVKRGLVKVPFLKHGILCHGRISNSFRPRFACWSLASNLQVAHGGWKLRAAGVLRGFLRSNKRCAVSAARICRAIFDHSDHTCLPRFLAGSGKVTRSPPGAAICATPEAGPATASSSTSTTTTAL